MAAGANYSVIGIGGREPGPRTHVHLGERSVLAAHRRIHRRHLGHRADHSHGLQLFGQGHKPRGPRHKHDPARQDASRPTSVTVSGPSTVAAGASYSATASAGGSPYPAPTFILENAPSWLTIVASTGAISGTVPTTATGFSYSVQATNPEGHVTSAPQAVKTLRAP